jgi:hypothetical protein
MAADLELTSAQRDRYIACMEDKRAELVEKRRIVAHRLRELTGRLDRIDRDLGFIDARIKQLRSLELK